MKLTEVRARPAAGLSHGEKRYLEIGMTLATDPKILLLDEPTADMSPAETCEATDLIRDVRDKLDLTIIMVEHDMSVVMGISDEVIVLHEGKVLAEGSPQEISDHEMVQHVYIRGDEFGMLEVNNINTLYGSSHILHDVCLLYTSPSPRD